MKRILGIDFGKRRIGIAVSDPLGIIARGVTTLANSPGVIGRIGEIAREHEVETIIIGMPYTLAGAKGQSAEEVESFIVLLRAAFDGEIIAWDERFSSHTAHETLLKMGVKRKARQEKERIDEMAAAIILQGYLDSAAGG